MTDFNVELRVKEGTTFGDRYLPVTHWDNIEGIPDLDSANLLENSVLAISLPKGGSYNYQSGSQSGLIKIALPSLDSTTMISFWVDVFDYATSESFSMFISGYTGTSGWGSYCTAITLTESTTRDFTVRFGDDGSKSCVTIGETTSAWNYIKVRVRNVTAGHANYTIDDYNDGWVVSVTTTALTTVDQVVTNNLPVPRLAASGTRGGIQIGYTSTDTNRAVLLDSEKAYVVVPKATSTVYGTSKMSLSGSTLTITT